MNDTPERILDTAERLFAEHGYSGTSLRAIITEADVNQAAVHYYFRSKEALLDAVLLRRTEPANAERMQMLERCEREAGDGPPELEEVIKAFVVPAFRAAYDPGKGGPVFRSLLGRLYAEGDILPRLAAAHFIPLLTRFAPRCREPLPRCRKTSCSGECILPWAPPRRRCEERKTGKFSIGRGRI